ncbi:MAG: methylated-DNA--[protein]-cysteine S-methyltransferase [Eggerthellaceae bacterium]|jgi:methylated-DNA-[protein]-cysteine S-methyltransferase
MRADTDSAFGRVSGPSYFPYQTPFGHVTIQVEDGAVTRLAFGDRPLEGQRRPTALSNHAANELQEYFAGKRRAFDIPLRLSGTPFQREVWEALQRIPYGQTRSYGEVAAAIGHAGASRAVGQANNRNPVPIFVPCHRVIAADGSISGYAFGPKVKQFLLDLEASHL